jgi:uncharacterized protein YegL
MKTIAKFTFDKVRHDQENEVHLVLSLTAPKIDWQSKRPPVCINLVADVSGSMGGGKLEYAKQSMMKLVDHLQPGDYCGLVAFESGVHPVYQPVEITMARKQELRAKIGDLHTMGGTNFSGGMLQGLEFSNAMDLHEKVIRRIIMFTDGCANEGVARHRPEIVKLLSKNRGRTSLSAFGYGNDADQELMADVAKEGQGNYAFIKNPDDAISAFAKELGGLLSTYAQNIQIRVEPHNGHKILKVISDVDVTEDNGKVSIKMTDILSEEARHLVFHMQLSKQNQALPREMNVADVFISYDLIGEDGKKVTKEEQLKAKILFVKQGEEQDKPTQEVDALVAIAQMVEKQIESESFAKAGNFVAAAGILRTQSLDFEARGHIGISRGIGKMVECYAAPAAYAGSTSKRMSVQKGTSRGYGLSGSDDDAGDVLRDVGIQMSNAAMADMDGSFKGPIHVGGGPISPPVVPVVPNPIQVPVTSSKKTGSSKSGLSKSRSKRW